MTVTVPEVATSATDGLPRTVHPGRVRVDVPVLLAVPGQTRTAWVEVDGHAGPAVVLHQGQPSRVEATSVVRPGATVTVRIVVDGTVLTAWQHRVGR